MSDVKQGDRVKWSEFGRRHNPNTANVQGTVTGRPSETLATVMWDATKVPSAQHIDFLDWVDPPKAAE